MASFASSYIPTTTSTVTRAADVISSAGSSFNSWYSPSASTVYAEFDSNVPDGANAIYPWTLYSSGSDFVACRTATGYSPGRLFVIARVSGSNAFSSESNVNGYVTMPIGAVKGAFAFAANNFGVSWNGGSSFTSSSGAIPTPNSLYLGSRDGTNNILNGHIKRLTYWNQTLSEPTLQGITQE